MSTMDKINELLLLAKRYDEIIGKISRERRHLIRFVSEMYCKTDTWREIDEIMDTRFIADLETLLEVLCEHWNIKREDLRFAYDGSFHKSDDLQDGEIEVDINDMFKIFDINSRHLNKFEIALDMRATINHAKLKFPVEIINYGEDLINVLTNTTGFSNRYHIDCAEIKPNYLKDILLECSLADICEKFGEFGENSSAYSNSLNRFKVDDASCVLFVEACDRYAEKIKLKDGVEPPVM